MRQQTVICILGMHRSGTSLVTRLLNIGGLYLGPDDHLMNYVSGNPRGHWEHQGILTINKEILSRLNGSWYDVPTFPQGWEHSPALADLRQRARQLIREEFNGQPLWGWKDPRTCLTLPFWRLIAGDLKCVLCVRNPTDVARSLNSRRHESVSSMDAHQLWLQYVHAALRHSAVGERVVVFYEDLMRNWQLEARRLVEFARGEDLRWAETRGKIAEFVENELWHHRSPVQEVMDDGDVSYAVKATYLALRLAAKRQGGARRDDALRLVGVLSEYAVEADAHLRRASEQERSEERYRLRAEAAEREAREAWEALRRHRAALGRMISASATPSNGGGSPLKRREYREAIEKMKAQAARFLPEDARVLVVSKGDDQLLDLPCAEVSHFPRGEGGDYAGFYPSSSKEAINHLLELYSQGARFIVFPATSLWWLEHYTEFGEYLQGHGRLITRSDSCAIYELARVS